MSKRTDNIEESIINEVCAEFRDKLRVSGIRGTDGTVGYHLHHPYIERIDGEYVADKLIGSMERAVERASAKLHEERGGTVLARVNGGTISYRTEVFDIIQAWEHPGGVLSLDEDDVFLNESKHYHAPYWRSQKKEEGRAHFSVAIEGRMVEMHYGGHKLFQGILRMKETELLTILTDEVVSMVFLMPAPKHVPRGVDFSDAVDAAIFGAVESEEHDADGIVTLTRLYRKPIIRLNDIPFLSSINPDRARLKRGSANNKCGRLTFVFPEGPVECEWDNSRRMIVVARGDDSASITLKEPGYIHPSHVERILCELRRMVQEPEPDIEVTFSQPGYMGELTNTSTPTESRRNDRLYGPHTVYMFDNARVTVRRDTGDFSIMSRNIGCWWMSGKIKNMHQLHGLSALDFQAALEKACGR